MPALLARAVCEIHGPMRYCPGTWSCAGFDGEGCPASVSDVDLLHCRLPPGIRKQLHEEIEGDGNGCGNHEGGAGAGAAG